MLPNLHRLGAIKEDMRRGNIILMIPRTHQRTPATARNDGSNNPRRADLHMSIRPDQPHRDMRLRGLVPRLHDVDLGAEWLAGNGVMRRHRAVPAPEGELADYRPVVETGD